MFNIMFLKEKLEEERTMRELLERRKNRNPIIMQDQADKSWINEDIPLSTSHMEKITKAFCAFLIICALFLTLMSLAIANELGNLMVSPEMASYMQIMGIKTIDDEDSE